MNDQYVLHLRMAFPPMTLILSRTFREVRSVAKRVGFVDADAAERSPRAAHHQGSLEAQVQQ